MKLGGTSFMQTAGTVREKHGACRKVLVQFRPIRIMAPMAQGLHLSQRMTLSQVLAPQLQQSLALLQAPTLELKALVEQELQQNPLLEEAPGTELDSQEKERDVPAAADMA